MRFRFLNGMDCPDWILSEVAVCAKLSAIKFKTFCSLCTSSLLEDRTVIVENEYSKYITETIDVSAIRRLFVAVRFILEKSSKACCKGEDLDAELQQLGLPAEHSKQISRVFESSNEKLREHLLAKAVKGPSLTINSIKEDGNMVSLHTTKSIEYGYVERERAPLNMVMYQPIFQALQRGMSDANDRLQMYS